MLAASLSPRRWPKTALHYECGAEDQRQEMKWRESHGGENSVLVKPILIDVVQERSDDSARKDRSQHSDSAKKR